jgi:hypothetical protein
VVLNYLRKYGLVDAANELQTLMSKNDDNKGDDDNRGGDQGGGPVWGRRRFAETQTRWKRRWRSTDELLAMTAATTTANNNNDDDNQPYNDNFSCCDSCFFTFCGNPPCSIV